MAGETNPEPGEVNMTLIEQAIFTSRKPSRALAIRWSRSVPAFARPTAENWRFGGRRTIRCWTRRSIRRASASTRCRADDSAFRGRRWQAGRGVAAVRRRGDALSCRPRRGAAAICRQPAGAAASGRGHRGHVPPRPPARPPRTAAAGRPRRAVDVALLERLIDQVARRHWPP